MVTSISQSGPGPMTLRHSRISVVLFLLDIDGKPHLLLLRHLRWGDWSLVGGHIEGSETPLETAVRETEEELAPLRVGTDIRVAPLVTDPVTWGPVLSRSAGAPTRYTVWFHYGVFLVDPTLALARVHDARLGYVATGALTQMRWPRNITNILARLRAVEGFSRVPPAWPGPISPTMCGMRLDCAK
jgi:8-oxo-dGTP pyrophosphatase MutT (NUDIX family)